MAFEWRLRYRGDQSLKELQILWQKKKIKDTLWSSQRTRGYTKVRSCKPDASQHRWMVPGEHEKSYFEVTYRKSSRVIRKELIFRGEVRLKGLGL